MIVRLIVLRNARVPGVVRFPSFRRRRDATNYYLTAASVQVPTRLVPHHVGCLRFFFFNFSFTVTSAVTYVEWWTERNAVGLYMLCTLESTLVYTSRHARVSSTELTRFCGRSGDTTG